MFSHAMLRVNLECPLSTYLVRMVWLQEQHAQAQHWLLRNYAQPQHWFMHAQVRAQAPPLPLTPSLSLSVHKPMISLSMSMLVLDPDNPDWTC